MGWEAERLISEEVEAVRMETDMFFHEYTDEEKEGEQWSFESWGRKLLFNKLADLDSLGLFWLKTEKFKI